MNSWRTFSFSPHPVHVTSDGLAVVHVPQNPSCALQMLRGRSKEWSADCSSSSHPPPTHLKVSHQLHELNQVSGSPVTPSGQSIGDSCCGTCTGGCPVQLLLLLLRHVHRYRSNKMTELIFNLAPLLLCVRYNISKVP